MAPTLNKNQAAFHAEYDYSDPYPLYRELLERETGVFSVSENSWLIAHHEQVAQALKHPLLSKKTESMGPSLLGRSMLFQDPPDHARLRGFASPDFSPAAVARMEPMIESIVDELIDEMRRKQTVDFLADFAKPLPVRVIAGILGIAPGDLEKLHDWSSAMVTITDQTGKPTPECLEAMQEAGRGLWQYFAEFSDHPPTPRCPYSGQSVAANQSASKTCSKDEEIANAILLLVAGHETAVNLLGNGLRLFLEHPDQMQRVIADARLLDSAVEEILRFESPVQRGTFRIASGNFVIAGCEIKEGDLVAPLIGAANRDHRVFTNPDTFDVARHPNRHLAFGSGPHFCLGSSLARTEAKMAFKRLFERLPGIHLVADHPTKIARLRNWFLSLGKDRPDRMLLKSRWLESTIVRGLQSLEIALPANLSGKPTVGTPNLVPKDGYPDPLQPLIEAQKSDSILSMVDRGIVSDRLRSYFGAGKYCNVGYWDDGCPDLALASRALVARVVDAINPECLRILDVGCGLGASTAQIKRARPNATVTGINISAFQIRECRKSFPECCYLPMDAANLEFTDASFEAVTSVEAAFHFSTREAFLRQAFRVLRPGGKLAMADIICHDGPMAKQIAIWPVSDANHLDDLDAYRRLLERVGFSDVRIEDTTPRTWLAWCANVERRLPTDLAEGVIDQATYDAFHRTLPDLAAAVKNYVVLSAVKA